MHRFKLHRDASSKSSLKSEKRAALDLAKETATTLLRLACDVSDPFPPLKAAAAGIIFIVERIEKTKDNQELIQDLCEHIKNVSVLTMKSDNEAEQKRRRTLAEEVGGIYDEVIEPLQQQGRVRRFLKASGDNAAIQKYTTKVRDATSRYHVQLAQATHEVVLTSDERTTLQTLAPVEDAAFNAFTQGCLDGTRVDILQTLRHWAEDPMAKQVYWLNGIAGSGKSTIARSFAEDLDKAGKLGASFFCSRDSVRRSDLKSIFPTIAYHLSHSTHPNSTKYRENLLATLRSNSTVASLALQVQIKKLIVDPLAEAPLETVVVIDALDECADVNTISEILRRLADSIAEIGTIKFFITSRPESHIRSGFRLSPLEPITDTIRLHEIERTAVDCDIRLFLQTRLAAVSKNRSDVELPNPWPTEKHLDRLTATSAGLFVFASTTVKFIEGVGDDPGGRLQEMLKQSGNMNKGDSPRGYSSGGSPYEDLDKLYSYILAQNASGTNVELRRKILGLLVVARELLSADTIASLLSIKSSAVRSYLRTLHSVILVPENPTDHIRFHHKSFPDFLTDRSAGTNYHVDVDDENHSLALQCLALMKTDLRRNICDLPRYAMNDVLESSVRDHCISEALRYCCRHWANHILSDNQRDRHLPALQSPLEHLLTTCQLMWFEVLSLIGELHRAVEVLDTMQKWLTSLDGQHKILFDYVTDGYRFVLAYFDVIAVSVTHIYHTALVFAPEQSVLKRSHSEALKDESKAIIGVSSTWDEPLRVIETRHTRSIKIYYFEYSHDGRMIAIVVEDECQIFLSATGERLAVLDHSDLDFCRDLSFSCDDKTIALAVDPGVVLWDVESGARLRMLTTPEEAEFISFHPLHSQSHLLFSAGRHDRVDIWDTTSSTLLYTFTLVNATCAAACWLAHQSQLAVVVNTSVGCTMCTASPAQQTRSFTAPRTELGRGSRSSRTTNTRLCTDCAVASSPNGLFIASSTRDGVVAIYNSQTGDIICSYNLDAGVMSLKFASTSPPTVLAAVRSQFLDNEVRAYSLDCNTQRRITSYDHREPVLYATFSPDGKFAACRSVDMILSIWETTPENAEFNMTQHHLQHVISAHFSEDGKLVVSQSADDTTKVWDSCTGELLQTLVSNDARRQPEGGPPTVVVGITPMEDLPLESSQYSRLKFEPQSSTSLMQIVEPDMYSGRESVMNAWIVDKQERKRLWLPSSLRLNHSDECGAKLLLRAKARRIRVGARDDHGGRLFLIDFGTCKA